MDEKKFILDIENINEIKKMMVTELSNVRKSSNLTQMDLSKLTKLPQSTISRTELLSRDVSLETLIRYADALGIELSITMKKKNINQDRVSKIEELKRIKEELTYQDIDKKEISI